MKIDYKIDLGHIVTFLAMFIGFFIQYGALSSRVTACEMQAIKTAETINTLNVTLNNLHDTIIQVQTQLEEREKRYQVQIAAADLKDAQRAVHESR